MLHTTDRQKPLQPAVMWCPGRSVRGLGKYDRGMASAHEIRQRMKEIQAAREAAFEPLAEVLEQRRELQLKLAQLDEPYGQKFAAAEAAGWTAEELVSIGAEEPVKRPKGRPRGKRAAAQKSAPEPTSPASSTTTTAAAAVPTQAGAGETADTPAGVSG